MDRRRGGCNVNARFDESPRLFGWLQQQHLANIFGPLGSLQYRRINPCHHADPVFNVDAMLGKFRCAVNMQQCGEYHARHVFLFVFSYGGAGAGHDVNKVIHDIPVRRRRESIQDTL